MNLCELVKCFRVFLVRSLYDSLAAPLTLWASAKASARASTNLPSVQHCVLYTRHDKQSVQHRKLSGSWHQTMAYFQIYYAEQWQEHPNFPMTSPIARSNATNELADLIRHNGSAHLIRHISRLIRTRIIVCSVSFHLLLSEFNIPDLRLQHIQQTLKYEGVEHRILSIIRIRIIFSHTQLIKLYYFIKNNYIMIQEMRPASKYLPKLVLKQAVMADWSCSKMSEPASLAARRHGRLALQQDVRQTCSKRPHGIPVLQQEDMADLSSSRLFLFFLLPTNPNAILFPLVFPLLFPFPCYQQGNRTSGQNGTSLAARRHIRLVLQQDVMADQSCSKMTEHTVWQTEHIMSVESLKILLINYTVSIAPLSW